MSKRVGGFINQDGLNAPDPATGVEASAGDGQAEVSFTAPSDVGGADITGYNVQASDGSRASGFGSSSYTGSSFSTNSQDTAPVDIKFKSDGTRMFILGIQNRSVYEYELSTPYDVTSATYTDAFSVATQATGGYGLFFKSDGTSFYVSDIDSETIYQYDCSTAWDISTAAYASKSFSVSSQSTDPRGLWFKSDGTKMYVGPSGTTDALFQYSLSSAWDVSTASYDSISLDVSAQESFVRAIGINSDGTKLYVLGNQDAVYEYLLPTAYVLTGGTYTGGNIDLSGQETDANGFAFNGPENKFYINGTGSDTVFEYSFGEYPTASPVTVVGLTNGTSYTFNVWAINPFGWSSPSDASESVSPAANMVAFMGGTISPSPYDSNVIDFININTTGNASDWGDLTVARGGGGPASNSIRGLLGGGGNRATSELTATIDYITWATTGNAANFGNLTLARRYQIGGCSNDTRGVFVSGRNSSNQGTQVMDYVTLASTGNATNFGNYYEAFREGPAGCASTTRGVFSGGLRENNVRVNTINYITIASASNSTDFGDLSGTTEKNGSASSSTRGLIFSVDGGSSNRIEYVTIASTGNSIDFGDLTLSVQYHTSGSNKTRAVTYSSYEYSGNTIDYVTIASAGNATDFGDVTAVRATAGTVSNAHGGLS